MSTISSGDENDVFLTVKEAVSVSDYSPTHLTRLAKSGKIKAEQKGGKWLLDPRSLERYLESVRGRGGRRDVKVSSRSATRIADRAGYSAAWTLNQTNFGPFNLRSLLESLAIAGCSVLVGLLAQGAAQAGLSVGALYEGGKAVAIEVGQRYEASIEGVGEMAAAIVAFGDRQKH